MRNRLVRVAFVLAALLCAAAATQALRMGVPWDDPWLFPVLVAIPAVAAILFALALRLPAALRVNVAMLMLATAVGLYALETVFALLPAPPPTPVLPPVGANGQARDTRSRLDVVADLRAAGTDAWPSFGARGLRMLDTQGARTFTINGERIAPLAQLARRTIVDCNEGGQYAVFQTDERGFNNPAGAWNGPITVAAVGDSYIQGSCVGPDETLVANLRRKVPGTVGLGLGDTGPLTMLGMIKEYLADVKPRDVFWFFYEGNDLRNLDSELPVAELRRYLEPGATQRLRERQAEIEAVLQQAALDLINGPREAETEPAEPPSLRSRARAWLTLQRLRSVLALTDVRARTQRYHDRKLLNDALAEARRTVESWGGRLHFVYLPAAGRYYRPFSALLDDDLRHRGRVLRDVRRLGLPIIDVHAAFGEHGDPRRLSFDFRSHYNPDGYRVAADAVLRYLEGLPASPDR
jgi:hypothetical protein